MRHLVRISLGLVVLGALGGARTADADDPAQGAANSVFEQRFALGTIKGTGHLFRIVVRCDRERLEQLSNALPARATRVVDYAFTFVQNTRDRTKARIDGSDLDLAVQRCIIDTYYNEVTFATGPWVPEVIPESVSFPAVLSKGGAPLAPETPIGRASR